MKAITEETATAPLQPCKFQQIENKYSSHPTAQCIARMVYLENKDELVICDSDGKTLKIYDSTTQSFITQINPDRLLDCPVAICTNINENIFVGDYTHSKIFVYDDYFEFLRSFGEGIIQKPFYMTSDPENGDIYVCDKKNNVITVWNSQTSEHLHDITCNSPTHSKILNDQLIVACGIDFDFNRGSLKLKRLIKGENCVFILNKRTRESVKTIKFNSWFDLRGLCVDEYMNIYTTAHEINEKFITNESFLYKFDLNGKLLKKFRLQFNHIRDMVMFDNKIIFTLGNRYPQSTTIVFQHTLTE